MRPNSPDNATEQRGSEGWGITPANGSLPEASPAGMDVPECRICLETDNQADMVSPCACHGTMQHAHLKCLKHWCAEKRSLACELCGQEYSSVVKAKLQPVLAAAEQRDAAQSFYTTYITLPMPESAPPPNGMARFWVHVALLTALLIGVLYVAFFVNVAGMDNFWVLFFWRILTVVLPLILIGRTIIALHHWRRQTNAQRELAQRIARAHERRQQLQQRLQQLAPLREMMFPQGQVRGGGGQGQQQGGQQRHAIFIS